MSAIEMTGLRFGRLVVVSRASNQNDRAMWLCLCDCGVTRVVLGDSMRRGKTTSCGCYRAESMASRIPPSHKTHGHSGYIRTGTYRCWMNMRARCYNDRRKDRTPRGRPEQLRHRHSVLAARNARRRVVRTDAVGVVDRSAR